MDGSATVGGWRARTPSRPRALPPRAAHRPNNWGSSDRHFHTRERPRVGRASGNRSARTSSRHRRPSFAIAEAQAASRSTDNSEPADPAGGRALTTTNVPGVSSLRCGRERCRRRRRTRLRHTAEPTALETTKPTRGSSPRVAAAAAGWSATGEAGCARNACTTRVRRPARTPSRTVRRKSSDRRIRAYVGNTGRPPSWRPSGRQLGAALAPAGGKDGAAGTGPHPETESVDPTTASIARLERALAHGKAPYIVYLTKDCPQMRAANRGHRAGGDLLTVRGRFDRVKLTLVDPEDLLTLSSRHADSC